MKTGLKVFCLGVIVFAGSLFLFQSSCAAEKIAFVDLGLVFDGYAKTKDYNDKLEGAQKVKQTEIDKRVDEIKAAQDKLSALADKQKDEKQQEITTKTRSLQEFQRNSEVELQEERNAKLKEVLEEIQKVIEAMGKKEGYDYILNQGVVLYGKPEMDISKQVLKQLNDSYKKK